MVFACELYSRRKFKVSISNFLLYQKQEGTERGGERGERGRDLHVSPIVDYHNTCSNIIQGHIYSFLLLQNCGEGGTSLVSHITVNKNCMCVCMCG